MRLRGRERTSTAVSSWLPAGAPYVFAPTDLPNLALWLDASDTSTITESSGSVSQWNDKSGNGRNFTQATAAKQPTTGTRTQNGRNVIDFDGSSDELSRTDTAALRPSTFTLFIVIARDSKAGRQDIFSNGNALQFATNNYIAAISTAAQAFLGRTPSSVLTAGTISAASTLRYVHNGSTITGAINGVATLNTSSTIGTDNTGGAFIGSALNASSWYDGVIGEIIFVGSVLTADQITSTESYLATKWGL
jgi:hypothetical protein